MLHKLVTSNRASHKSVFVLPLLAGDGCGKTAKQHDETQAQSDPALKKRIESGLQGS